MAQIVYTGTTGQSQVTGQLFAGKTFFLTLRIPMRSSFISDIEANGGRITKIEAQAQYVIADHVRADAPPGSLSYKFIEKAIRDGAIPDEAELATARPKGAVRQVGSSIPGKSTRTPFTHEDDIFLWREVEASRAKGGAWKGNHLYQTIAEKVQDVHICNPENLTKSSLQNTRHTFQSWRDRYMRHLVIKPPTIPPENAPPTPPAEVPTTASTAVPEARPQPRHAVARERPVSVNVENDVNGALNTIVDEAPENEDFAELMDIASDVENIALDQISDAWDAWHLDIRHRHRTASEWHHYYNDTVRPEYLKRKRASRSVSGQRMTDERLSSAAVGSKVGVTSNPEKDTSVAPHAQPNPSVPVMNFGGDMTQDERVNKPRTSLELLRRKRAESESARQETSSPSKRRRLGESGSSEATPAAEAATTQEQPMAHEPSPELGEGDRSYLSRVDDTERRRSAYVENVSTSEIDRLAQMQLQVEAAHALTAENLAKISEQEDPHRVHSGRGMDLPEDDPDKDQEDYAEYLEKLLHAAKPPAIEQNLQKRESGASSRLKLARRTPMVDESASEDDSEDSQELEDVDDQDDPTVHQENVQSEQAHQPAGLEQPEILDQTNGVIAAEDAPLESGASSPLFMPPKDGFNYRVATSSSVDNIDAHARNADEGEGLDRIELDMAAPEGGWEQWNVLSGESSGSDFDLPAPEELLRRRPGPRAKHALETQAIYDADTLQPDLDIPEPDEEEESLPSRSRAGSLTETVRPRQSILEIESQDAMEEWQESMRANGHEQSDIWRALHCTSMRPGLAEIVLDFFQQRKGIPDVISGIWTEHDDGVLDGGDPQGLRMLQRKHGQEEMDIRWQFLAEFRAE